MAHPRFTLLGQIAAIKFALNTISPPEYDPFNPNVDEMMATLRDLAEIVEALGLTIAEARETASHLKAKLILEVRP